ncbi:MAG: hypothetical protein IJL55_11300 [Lachnospiraceae bacterium]|nr:hypothetical protein [Lachnospiraceae bacterium]
MNRHEKFVEKIKKTYYKDILADSRITINVFRKDDNSSGSDIKSAFESLYDGVFDDDDD